MSMQGNRIWPKHGFPFPFWGRARVGVSRRLEGVLDEFGPIIPQDPGDMGEEGFSRL
jgi:hypothetical protein